MAISVWTYTYVRWSNRPLTENYSQEDIDLNFPHVITGADRYLFWVQTYDSKNSGLRYLYLLVIIVIFMWLRFLLML